MISAITAIFLIVDRGPAHIAKTTRAFVDSQHGRLRLFFLPPYSPDSNPDELVWKHLKADTVGRMTISAVISQKLLNEAGFDGFVETICQTFLCAEDGPAGDRPRSTRRRRRRRFRSG